MPFPDYGRVIYQRNPLIEVICQVRFPPVLRIDVEPPAAFQEAIRDEFEVLSEDAGIEAPLPIPPEMARRIPPEMARQLGALRMGIGPAQKTTSSRRPTATGPSP